MEREDPETAAETRPFTRYAEEAQAGDVLVYQFATASALGPWLGARPEALVVNYHNVTPPEYYAPWDNGLARHQLLAQAQLRELAPPRRVGLAVSSFNEAELRQAGSAAPLSCHPPPSCPRGRRPARARARVTRRPRAGAGSASGASPPQGRRAGGHGAAGGPGT